MEEYNLQKEGELYVTEVPIGSGKRFGFRKWTWGEKNNLVNSCLSFDPISGVTTTDSNKFDEQLFVMTIFKEVEGKFVKFTVEEARNLDGQLGERLSRITQKLNLVKEIDARNL
jgi:hypothetical protein